MWRKIASLFFILQFALGSRVHAESTCESLFETMPFGATMIASTSLPPKFRQALTELDEKTSRKLQKRFERRDRVSAENEAKRMVANLLLDGNLTSIQLLPIFSAETRVASIHQLLSARQNNEIARARLQLTLLEIGYGEGSATARQWSAFRKKHRLKLTIAAQVAKNFASAVVLGLPLFLNSKTNQNFQISSESSDKVARDLKTEIAAVFISRILGYAVLAILTDEFLTFLTPKWGLLKLKTYGHLRMESREELERVTYQNWKEIIKGFTGETPADNSPEMSEIREKIRATSKDDLWLHVHEGGALTEPEPTPSTSLSHSEADQMFPEPIVVP